MVKYPEANILIQEEGGDWSSQNLNQVKGYLELVGNVFYQNYNSAKKESGYFIGDSVVLIKEFKKTTDIKIHSSSEDALKNVKSDIEEILRGFDLNPICT